MMVSKDLELELLVQKVKRLNEGHAVLELRNIKEKVQHMEAQAGRLRAKAMREEIYRPDGGVEILLKCLTLVVAKRYATMYRATELVMVFGDRMEVVRIPDEVLTKTSDGMKHVESFIKRIREIGDTFSDHPGGEVMVFDGLTKTFGIIHTWVTGVMQKLSILGELDHHVVEIEVEPSKPVAQRRRVTRGPR